MTRRAAHFSCIRHRLLALQLAALVTGAPALAGVTLDGTMGSTGSFSGNMTVPASVGTQRGANLFHSFGTFNIFTGESLYFTATGSSAAISNVISRVTGGSGSTINGVLGSTVPGASVFLINPGGIVFGPSAQLDVSGSFYASTANYLTLADGGRFDATTPSNTVLTVAAPAAFGFLGPTPAAITVSGSILQVPDGQSLGLIGGDVSVSGAAILAAPGGNLHLVSAASAGEANIGAGAFEVSSFATPGAISISGGSTMDVSEPAGQTIGGGTVYIRGGSLVLDGSSLLAKTAAGSSGGVDISVSGDMMMAADALIDSSSSGTGRAGNVNVAAAGTMSMDASRITSRSSGDGNAGNIQISAASLNLTNSSISSSGGYSADGNPGFIGRGGNITIGIAGTMSMDNSTITSRAYGEGDAGSIQINAGNLNLTNDALIYSGSGSGGSSGDTTISVAGTMAVDNSRISASAYGNGNAGNTRIDAGAIDLANGALIDSASIGGGRGGDITISASGTMAVDNSRITATAFGDGNAGNILIDAGAIDLANGALIDSQNSSGGRGGDITISASGTMAVDNSRISASAYGDGNAGNMLIDAGAINLANGALIDSASNDGGRGGDITISTPGTMLMDASLITSAGLGDGDAGSILINANNLNLSNWSSITSAGGNPGFIGRGGNITIGVTGTMSMDASTITSKAYGEGDAGNIQISAGSLNLTNFARISSSGSSGAGGGGDIAISTAGTLSMDDSSITSETFGDGDAGSILINAANLDLTNWSWITSAGGNSGSIGRGGNIAIGVTGTMSMDASTITSKAYGEGDAGSIQLSAGSLNLTNFAKISSSGSSGAGGGGDIAISTPGTMSMDYSSITSETLGDGNAGSILINAANLDLTNWSWITSAGGNSGFIGRGGNITIGVTGTMSMDHSTITSKAYGEGDAGNIQIGASSLSLANFAEISSSGSFSTGSGGDIAISTAGTVSMDYSSITSKTYGDGAAGNIQISAGSLDLTNFARIDSGSWGAGGGGDITISTPGAMSMDGSYITSKTYGEGDAGNIQISAGSLDLTNFATINSSSSWSTGRGGNITINTPGTMSMDDSYVTSETFGDGNAGSILINAADLNLSNDSWITSAGGDPGFIGRGGNIAIGVTGTMSMDASMVTSKAYGEGDAGNIQISAGSLRLTNLAKISSSGSWSTGGGGNITISTPGTISMDASTITSEALGDGAAGDMSITVGTLDLSGGAAILASTAGAGRGGSISVNSAQSVSVTGESKIDTSTSGEGSGGNVSVASPLVSLAEFGSIRSATNGSGNAGSVTIDAGELRLTSGGFVSAVTSGAGAGGNIAINADRIEISGGQALPAGEYDAQRDATDYGFYSGIYVNAEGPQTGNGGLVLIKTGDLIITDAGVISGITTGAANAGNIHIEADRVRLESGGLIATSTAGSGNAGNITMNVAESLVIDGRYDAQKYAGFTPRESPNSGAVSTATLNLNPNANILGNGGTITLTVPSLSIANYGEISTAADLQGSGGSVVINANDILMSDHAQISAKSDGSGNAGDIRVFARDSMQLTNGSTISTEASMADGGNIDIRAGFMLHLTDSRITTSVGTGLGDGGNITIDPVLVILDNGRIVANAFGGRGGNISITTEQLIADPHSVVDASSALGIDGSVEISSPNTDVGANLGVLPATLFDASALMRDSCAVSAGAAAANSFVGVGRGGLPLDPVSTAYSTYAAPETSRTAAGNLAHARAKAGGTSVVYLASALQELALASPCRL